MAVINFKTADKGNYLQGNRGNEYRTFEFPKNIKNKIYVRQGQSVRLYTFSLLSKSPPKHSCDRNPHKGKHKHRKSAIKVRTLRVFSHGRRFMVPKFFLRVWGEWPAPSRVSVMPPDLRSSTKHTQTRQCTSTETDWGNWTPAPRDTVQDPSFEHRWSVIINAPQFLTVVVNNNIVPKN